MVGSLILAADGLIGAGAALDLKGAGILRFMLMDEKALLNFSNGAGGTIGRGGATSP